MKLDIDHVLLPVRDARATHRFYSKVLGLTLDETYSGAAPRPRSSAGRQPRAAPSRAAA